MGKLIVCRAKGKWVIRYCKQWRPRTASAIYTVFIEGTKQQVAVATVGVFLSATKIVIGTQYSIACPVQELLPVFLVVSGCLPAFLCAWRGLFDWNKYKGQKRLVNRIWISFGVAGILLNVTCLTGGTWLTSATWTRMGKDVCATRKLENVKEDLNITSIYMYNTHSTISATVYNTTQTLNLRVVSSRNSTSTSTPSPCGTGSELVRPCALPLLMFTTFTTAFDWLFLVLSCFCCATGRWRLFCEYDVLQEYEKVVPKRGKIKKSVTWQDMEM